MRRDVANVALTPDELDQRLGVLRSAFPDLKFDSESHDTRSRIFVETDALISTPDFEQMIRVATTGVAPQQQEPAPAPSKPVQAPLPPTPKQQG